MAKNFISDSTDNPQKERSGYHETMNLTHLANEEWVSSFKSHKFVQIKENVEEMPRQFAPSEVFQCQIALILGQKCRTNSA